MTLEEALKKIQELETELTTERKKVSDQNSYITKLEAQVNNKPNEGGSGQDPIIQAYIERKMREDVLAQAVSLIKSEVSDEEYKAIEPDFLDFLEKNMKKANTKVEYIMDAFSLVWGRCLRKKDHPIHKVKAATPSGTTPQGTNVQTSGNVPPIVTQPPGITDGDGGSTPPPSTETRIANTKDAFSALKKKMGTIGGNRFS